MEIEMEIDDALLERAKAEAARRGTTVSALVEEGMRLLIEHDRLERSKKGDDE
jgi:hypothetical protein